MKHFVKALSTEDRAQLTPIDQAYAELYGLEPIVQNTTISFFVRTGHAFVAIANEEIQGFVLAQAIFNGNRPTVYASRLAIAQNLGATNKTAKELRQMLVNVVTKSAYDAAVYDLRFDVPKEDIYLQEILEHTEYNESNMWVYSRALGSRSQNLKSKN